MSTKLDMVNVEDNVNKLDMVNVEENVNKTRYGKCWRQCQQN